MKKKESTSEMQSLKATVWIGKKGITDSTISEIKAQIKEKKIIKVKWLRNTDIVPEDIAELADSRIVQKRGSTMIIGKK